MSRHDDRLGALCMCDDCLAREQQESDKTRRPHPEDGTFVDDGPWDLDYGWFYKPEIR